MHIQYEISKEDYIQFNMFHVKHSPTVQRTLFIQRYIISLVFLVVPFVMHWTAQAPLKIAIPIFFITYVLWVIMYPKHFMKNIKKNTAKMIDEGKDESLLGSQELWVTEDGIVKKTDVGEVKTSWKAVQKVTWDESILYIYVGVMSAYIIPFRAFKTEEEKEKFIQEVNKYIAN
ncbi:MAG: YcxB family protein [Epulopiscium sp.]|nr:YcxB family protein [Candidatus Epulonipiscium sp.]